MTVALAFIAMLIELCLGYPLALHRAIGHPVTWIGRLIAWLDRTLNREPATALTRRATGVAAILILLAVVGVLAFLVQSVLLRLPFGILTTALVGSTLVAQRSLHRHVADVAAALETGGTAAGRQAVGHIVGRDTDTLDAAGVARAAIESLAENFSDAIVAPVFWLAIGGLPGSALYKAINTADSMIGHRTPRYEAFGWAAARLDDLVNLPASRLSALLLVTAAALSGNGAGAAWRTVSWRRGTKGRLSARFAAVRVRVADGPTQRIRDMGNQHMPGDEAWLVGERRASGERKYYLSNLPADASIKALASTIKARWICEQAHQQLKEELGLDHFEGRSWHGLHRHALMTMIAYAFLQHRRLAAAKREKKSRRATTTAKLAGSASCHHHLYDPCIAPPMPALSVMAQGVA